MSYYFSKRVSGSFESAVARVTEALQKEGFGVLTEIDVHAVMMKKLGVTMKPYKILGACNPQFAHKALEVENKIGTMLPCNVIVQQLSDTDIEVSAVDPISSMQAVGNAALGEIAGDVQSKLKGVIDSL
ncbi:MAG TPA: DUF302 domain-containing protein [Spirochaetia bacterium]|nr:DUF302 domain-containing protein [Spirochaetia bacterium]